MRYTSIPKVGFETASVVMVMGRYCLQFCTFTVPIYIPDQLSYSVFKVFQFYAYPSTKPVKAFGNERKALDFSLFHPSR